MQGGGREEEGSGGGFGAERIGWLECECAAFKGGKVGGEAVVLAFSYIYFDIQYVVLCDVLRWHCAKRGVGAYRIFVGRRDFGLLRVLSVLYSLRHGKEGRHCWLGGFPKSKMYERVLKYRGLEQWSTE